MSDPELPGSDAPRRPTWGDSGGAALSPAELQNRAVRGAGWTMIHTVVSLPIAFVANLFVARALGAADYGRLALLTAMMTVVSGVVAMGVSSALMQFASKAHAAGHPDEVRDLLSLSQGYRLLVIAPTLSAIVFVVADVAVPVRLGAIVFGVWVPAALEGLAVCLQVENKTAADAKIAMVSNMLIQGAVVAVAVLAKSADGVWLTRLVASSLSLAFAYWLVDHGYRRAVLRPRLPHGFPEGFWRFALPVAAAGIVGSLVLSRSEVFLLQWLSTPTAVGTFALAFGLSNHIFAPAQALIGPLLPAVSALHEIDPGALRLAFERVLRASSTIVALLCGLGMAPLAALVPSLYGQEFAATAPLLIALGVSGAVTVMASPVAAFVLARLTGGHLLASNAIALVVNVGVALSLIPPLGVWGAAIGNVSGVATSLAVLLWSEMRALGMRIRDVGALTLPAGLGIVATGLAWVGTATLADQGLVRAFAALVVGAGLVMGGLRLFASGLTQSDAEAILRVLPAAMRGIGGRALTLVTSRRAG